MKRGQITHIFTRTEHGLTLFKTYLGKVANNILRWQN